MRKGGKKGREGEDRGMANRGMGRVREREARRETEKERREGQRDRAGEGEGERGKGTDAEHALTFVAIVAGRYLRELQNKERCDESWSLGWRSKKQGNTCLEPDGCLWRKLDESARNPGGVNGYMQAENTYSMPFIAHLSRFIINHDERWTTWWRIRQQALAPNNTPEQDQAVLNKELSVFAASVEYGLANYPGQEGVDKLAEELLRVYGDMGDDVRRQLFILWALQGARFQPATVMDNLAQGWQGGGIIKAPAPENIARSWQQIFAASSAATQLDRKSLPSLLPSQTPVYRNEAGVYSLPVSVAYNQFGERGYYPVRRERALDGAIYGAFALSGLIGCAGTHAAVVPLDVVKTRKQAQPDMYPSLAGGIKTIWRDEGLGGLFAGGTPTVLGYMWYGFTVYPGYELFKRIFTEAVGEANDAQYHVLLVLLSGACATVLACFGVCPAEATRIRQVSDPKYAPTAFGVASKIVAEEGFLNGLYTGFGLLLVRQISFGMMKFLVFESFATSVYAALPFMDDNQALQLTVSLLSGAVAGVVSTIVSQPADTVLTAMKSSTTLSFTDAMSKIYNKYGLQGFFLGLSSRCVWAGSIIAGQFLLYDVGKNLFQVTSDDLTLFLDVIGSVVLTGR